MHPRPPLHLDLGPQKSKKRAEQIKFNVSMGGIEHLSPSCRVALQGDQPSGSTYLLEAERATGSTYLLAYLSFVHVYSAWQSCPVI